MSSDSGNISPTPGTDSSSANAKTHSQIQTGMSKPYEVKGDSAIREWAQHWYPTMSPSQLNQFVQKFLMTICQQISQQIGKEMQRARKEAQKLKRAEEGEE